MATAATAWLQPWIQRDRYNAGAGASGGEDSLSRPYRRYSSQPVRVEEVFFQHRPKRSLPGIQQAHHGLIDRLRPHLSTWNANQRSWGFRSANSRALSAWPDLANFPSLFPAIGKARQCRNRPRSAHWFRNQSSRSNTGHKHQRAAYSPAVAPAAHKTSK